ncbi:MAG: DUF3291 domain-containing protein [Pseudoxanthomonas sp.]|nr:DUF3291 domain-containing protein [Pseudoxanthomonas sp.]
MSRYELAQLNIARMRAPLDSPLMADFVGNIERINSLAEAMPGYVWRLKDESGDATALRPFGDDVLVNMSVWKDVESLRAFTYRSDHASIMRRRHEWTERMDEAYAVFWWVSAGHRPGVLEAWERLEHLRMHGASPRAFTLRTPFPAPDAQMEPVSLPDPAPAAG